MPHYWLLRKQNIVASGILTPSQQHMLPCAVCPLRPLRGLATKSHFDNVAPVVRRGTVPVAEAVAAFFGLAGDAQGAGVVVGAAGVDGQVVPNRVGGGLALDPHAHVAVFDEFQEHFANAGGEETGLSGHGVW